MSAAATESLDQYRSRFAPKVERGVNKILTSIKMLREKIKGAVKSTVGWLKKKKKANHGNEHGHEDPHAHGDAPGHDEGHGDSHGDHGHDEHGHGGGHGHGHGPGVLGTFFDGALDIISSPLTALGDGFRTAIRGIVSLRN